jgi:glycosyltransferase involved in cell wall biosynthesis
MAFILSFHGEQMKILHLANHCHEIGNGIMNVAVDLACEQARVGHTVSFASAGGSYVELLHSHGVAHYVIAQHWRKPSAALSGFLRLQKLLATSSPDVIHAHMVAGALMAYGLKLFSKFILVTTVHNEWQRSAILMGVGDRVIAVSSSVRDSMKDRGISDAKLRIVRNGPLGSPRRRGAVTEKILLRRPAIITIAGLYRRKGISDLILAFERVASAHPSASLYIVGDGPHREEFVALANASQVCDRISFLGFLADPRSVLCQADIFVLASHSEPFGLVLAEAREAGCAVVGTSVGGIPEVLEKGGAGILVEPRNPDALADVLTRLLADRQMLQHWREQSRKDLEWLTCARSAQDTMRVYSDALVDRAGHMPRSGWTAKTN